MPTVPDSLKPYRLYLAMLVLSLAVVGGVLYLSSRAPARPLVVSVPPTRAAKQNETPARIIVSVNGAVQTPGAVALESGALLAHALQAARVQADADVSKLDLTRALQDGDKIFVPSNASAVAVENPKPTVTQNARVSAVATVPSANAKLNLNTATLQELDALPGIGPALAQRILDYRAQNGSFKNIEELQEVKGIGETLFNEIKELVTVQ